MKLTRHKVAVLAVSHIFAAGVGAGVGYAWDLHYGKMIDSLNQYFAHFPRSNAAELAFRFGSPEDARALLALVPVSEESNTIHWGMQLMRDLKLAVISKELEDAGAEAANLASAAQDCTQLRRTSCTPADMRNAAGKLALRRKP